MRERIEHAREELRLALIKVDYPFAVIGIDPGGTTGAASYIVESADKPPIQDKTAQWGEPDHVTTKMMDWRYRYNQLGIDNVVFAIEQFDNRPGIVDPDLTPLYIINDIKRYMPDAKVFWQTPAQAKNLVKPAVKGAPDGLRRFGWYQPGLGHANDASRHVITFLVEKVHHKPTILLGWPKRDGS